MGASGAAPNPAAAEAPGAGAGGADGGEAGGAAAGADGGGADGGADESGGADGDGAGVLAASAGDAASAHAPVKIVAICERMRRGTGESYRKSRGTSRAKYLCAGQ
jgi:hypothetical protein